MEIMQLSIVEPFSSPTWGSNFAVFSSSSALPIPEEKAKEYLGKACRYAKSFGVYLVPERFVMLGSQSACLIDPTGKVIGAQQAICDNLTAPTGKHSDRIDVWKTEFGGIFLAVDVDIYRPEIIKIAHNMGACIVIASQHFAAEQYTTHRVVSGVWNASQSNHLFAVGVSNHYHCICAPKELTARKDGFLAAPTMKFPVTAKFAVKQLETLAPRPLLSRQLYARHREHLLEPIRQTLQEPAGNETLDSL